MWRVPAICVALALSTVSCASGATDPGASVSLAEPHLDDFDARERWLRRGMTGEPAFRSRAALEETLFAPMRGDESVVAAWVARGREVPFVYGDAPTVPDIAMRSFRDPVHGEVAVARAAVTRGNEAIPCVLVSRETESDGTKLAVTIAFREN